MQITTIGLDVAKNVFQVHGIDAAEKVAVRKQLRRSQVLEFLKALPPRLIGLEACATAHYWARVSAWTCRSFDGKADQKIVPPRLRIPSVDIAHGSKPCCETVSMRGAAKEAKKQAKKSARNGARRMVDHVMI
jgi:hypothetical protein